MFNTKKNKVSQTDLATLLTAIGVLGAKADMSIIELTQLGSDHQAQIIANQAIEVEAAIVVPAPVLAAPKPPDAVVEAVIEEPVIEAVVETPAVIQAVKEETPTLIDRVTSLEGVVTSQADLIAKQSGIITQLTNQGNQFNLNFGALGKYVGNMRNEPSTQIVAAVEAVALNAAPAIAVASTNKKGHKNVSMKANFLTSQDRRPTV
jgi:hypothetical protein